MKKSEMRNEIQKAKASTLQKVGRWVLLLMMAEIIAWNVKGMNPFLLVAILATCLVKVAVCMITLKELGKQNRERK